MDDQILPCIKTSSEEGTTEWVQVPALINALTALKKCISAPHVAGGELGLVNQCNTYEELEALNAKLASSEVLAKHVSVHLIL